MGPDSSDFEKTKLREGWDFVNEKEKDDARNSLEKNFRNNFQWTI